MPTVSFQAPSEYQAQAQEIERRRQMADLLQKQALEPIQTQPTPPGGFAVPISWTQGLAKLLQGYGARKGQERATADQTALASKYNTERGQALAAAMRAGMGTPASSESIMDETANGGEGQMAQINAPAVPGSRQAMIAQLTGSKFPELQQAGMAQALSDMKPIVVGKSIMTPTGQLVGTDPAWQQEQEASRLERSEQAAAQRQQRQAELEARLQDQRLAREDRAALQRELQASREQSAREMRTLAAGLRQPQIQPLVQIMTPNGPQWVERKDAIGQMPAGAGSQAETKAAGKADVDKDVVKLKDMLDRLKAGGGITDTTQGAMPNIGAAIGSSAVGQMVGGALGTKNQSARNELLMIRPSLLRSIMSSTGMSAKQMDSNAELKLWLSTATDPTKDYQANIEALNNIASKYGSGPIIEGGRTAAGSVQPAGALSPQEQAELDALRARFGKKP